MRTDLMKRLRRPLCALLAAAFVSTGIWVSCVSGLVSAASGDADVKNDANVQKYEQQIADYEKKQAKLKEEIAALNDNVKDFSEKKARYDELVEICEKKIETSEILLAQLKVEAAALEIEIKEKNEDRLELYEQIKERIVVSYEAGGNGATYLELIFGAKSLTDFLIGLDNAISIMEYDTKLMQDYKDVTEQLEKKQERLSNSIAGQEKLIASLEAERAETEKLILQSENVITNAMKDIESSTAVQQKIAAAADAAAKELDDYIDWLESQYGSNMAPATNTAPAPETTTPPPETTTPPPETTTPPPETTTPPPETTTPPPETTTPPPETTTPPPETTAPEPETTDPPVTENTPPADDGSYMWPLDPQYTDITSYFGPRNDPFTGVPSNHGGTDIYAPRGSNIYAVKGGTVVKSEKNDSYGYYILIDHGGNIYTLYAHCSKLLVSEGTYVAKGTVIAKVGDTGHATGNHLHLELRIGKTRVDALDYVKVP